MDDGLYIPQVHIKKLVWRQIVFSIYKSGFVGLTWLDA